MLFNTPEFAIFFALALIGTWALAERPRLVVGFLLAASAWFYAAWDPRFLALMAAVTVVDWLLGLALERTAKRGLRRAIVASCVASHLAVIAYWKYAAFLLAALAPATGMLGLELREPLHVVLPVGISFFTFEGLSYVVDVYRKDLPAERSLPRLALFISFFPHLVAGPIVRAGQLLEQLTAKPRLEPERFGSGLVLVFSGLAKKLVLADVLARDLVDRVYDFPSRLSSVEVAVAIVAYSFQIYCDFSGYSDVALGTARMLGYELPRNVDAPYRAASPRELWRRWHISLSTWLRDYLYRPLGGSRHGRLRTASALMATMVLGGLWHGAAWTFVAWGALHGAALVVEHALATRSLARTAAPPVDSAGELSPRRDSAREAAFPRAIHAGKVLATFAFVSLAWVPFRAPDITAARAILSRLADGSLGASNVPVTVVLALAIAIATHALPDRFAARAEAAFARMPALLQAAGVIAALYGLRAVSSGAPAPFIYFQF